MTKNGLTQYRLKDIENKVDDLDVKVEQILINHLPHIQEEISIFKSRLNYFTAFNIGAIILALLIGRYLI